MAWLTIIGAAQAKYASIVIDYASGRVLHEVNADTRNYPASLTKMMTLYMVFEALEDGSLRLDEPLKVSRRAAGMPPSRLGLRASNTITVERAILALVTKSANDVAVVVAERLGGSESKFARKMTDRARALGMSRTTFRNASGLPNRRQMSTARDMATLSIALLRDFPERYAYFSTRSFRYQGRTYRNHNKLLARYSGTDGIKTGYTRASGFNLAASVERNGRRLVAVVFGGKTGKSRDRHMMSLLSRGYVRVAALDRPVPDGAPARKPIQLAASTALAQGGQSATAEGTGEGTGVLGLVSPAQAAVPDGPYAVQVGAFMRHAPAMRMAESAAARLSSGILSDHQIVVSRKRGRTGTFYRSRLIGFSRDRADTLCRELKSQRIDCLVVRHGAAG